MWRLCTPGIRGFPDDSKPPFSRFLEKRSTTAAGVVSLFQILKSVAPNASVETFMTKANFPYASTKTFISRPDEDGFTHLCFVVASLHPDQELLATLAKILLSIGA